MKQSQFYYLLRRGLFSAGSAIIKNGLVMFNKFTTAGLNFPAQGSAEFNGTSDYILTNDLGGEYLGSFSCWFYTTTGATTSTPGDAIIDFDSTDSESFLHLGPITGSITNEVICILKSWRVAVTNINISAGWHHLAFTQTHNGSSSTYKVYLDGSEQTITTSGTPQQITLKEVTIGAWNASNTISRPWDGNLANVAIWNRALTSDEINSVMWKSYEALTGAESNGLQAWYSLDDITSPAASLANMEQLATDKDATIENKAAITAAINALS